MPQNNKEVIKITSFVQYFVFLEETQVLFFKADLATFAVDQVPALRVHQVPVLVNEVLA